jgi:hypothetical protein
MSGKREIPKTLHLKLSLLYDYIYIQFLSMLSDHRLYILNKPALIFLFKENDFILQNME